MIEVFVGALLETGITLLLWELNFSVGFLRYAQKN